MSTPMSSEGSQHGKWRVVGMAGLIGAGTSFALWSLVFVWMLVGLTVGMPTDMGGMGLPYPVALLLACGAVALVATVIVLTVIRLLRHAGTAHPGVVALVGTLLATCLFGTSSMGLNILVAAQTGPVWMAAPMLPLSGAGGFAIIARFAHHRVASMTIALACTAVIATFLTW